MSDADDVLLTVWRSVAGVGQHETEAMLVDRHGEPGRHYHTAEHVRWVLHHVEMLLVAEPSDALDADAVRVAALFHDIVYDPRSTTNEADSAGLAVGALAALDETVWPTARRQSVGALIEATASHQASTPEAAVLLDADLAVLGAEPAAYADYARHVRLEYGFVPDDAWRTGRSTVLHSFLDRPRIFATSTMFSLRESAARSNLAAELASLQQQPPSPLASPPSDH